jgi:two-component system sensor histidine kinase YesM
MKIVDLYLSIIDIRFSGKYHFDIDIDGRILKARTIKMIIQPIVENAVHHGLSAMDEDGILSIQGTLSDNIIVFRISDNGPGMSIEELGYIKEVLNRDLHESVKADSRCLGLFNINRRIKLNFGSHYGVSLESDKLGTTVTICLPYNEH